MAVKKNECGYLVVVVSPEGGMVSLRLTSLIKPAWEAAGELISKQLGDDLKRLEEADAEGQET